MKTKILFFIVVFFTLSGNILTAQNKSKKITIYGYVNDSVYKPVVGAKILVDYKDTQVITDGNGYYKIRTRPDAVAISAFSPDRKVKTELIDGRSVINFSMGGQGVSMILKENDVQQNESIDIGYGKIDPKRTAVPVSKSDVLDVSGDEYSAYKDIYQMIQGRVPGVDVKGKTIRVRGVNSLIHSNDPLFVVDGMPVNSIDYILPHEVQSITLLKGSATTMYGSRGVNGVIVIVLKKNPNINK